MSKAEDLAGLLDANGDVLATNLDNVSVAFADVTSKPTTLAGYGITDAASDTELTNAVANSANWDTAYGWGDHSTQGYATTTYVDGEVANLVASAPATLDTLNELAAALGDDPNYATTVTTALGLKANSADLATVATTGAYSDLSGTPTAVSSFTNDSGYIADVVSDTTPQLGGDLDTNGNAILFGSSKWSVELDTGDNDLLFKYNGTTVFKIASNGAITSANEVTAYGSP